MTMNRREFVLAGLAGIGAMSVRSPAKALGAETAQTGYASTPSGERVYYEVTGPESGPPLFLTVPVYGTYRIWTDTYLAFFTDKYRVLVADYPHNGRSDALRNEAEFTGSRVVDDYLAIATAAWGDTRRFGVAGYSWGGNASLLLATSTERVSAVAVGGWPALEGPWARLLEISRDLDSARYIAYYESMQEWAQYKYEAKKIKALRVPRLNYVDSDDDGLFLGQTHATSASMIGPFRKHRETLHKWGWETAEVRGGIAGEQGHTGGIRPDIAGPVIRSFLDKYF